MAGKVKSKAIRVRRVAAKKESVLRKSSRAVRRRAAAQISQKSKKKYPSLLGKMKGTVLYESDLISPINEIKLVDFCSQHNLPYIQPDV